MKTLLNILKNTKHILLMIVLICFLTGCSDEEKVVVGKVCEGVGEKNCIDTRGFRCIGCEILELIYNSAGSAIMSASGSLSQGAMAIMMLGFALWVALRLIKFVGSVTENNVRQIWNEILKKAFICLFCGILASTSSGLNFVINSIIFPVYTGFMDLGTQILNSAVTEKGGKETSLTVMGTTITVRDINVACKVGDQVTATDKGFPQGLREAMLCMIQKVTSYLSIGKGIAHTSMKNADSFFARIAGVIIWFCFTITALCFSLYLVGGIFQMGIMILLLPVFIMAYAFETTKSWTKKCFEKIVVSSGFMMCFSIIVAMVIRGMVELIIGHSEIFNPKNPEVQMKDVSVAVMCLILIAFIIYEAMGVSNAITSGLIGGKMDDSFQKNFKAVLQLGFSMVRRAVGAAFTLGVSVAPDSAISKAYELYKKTGALKAKIERYAGRK